MVNIENLIRLATLVRDETANKQNTALRVGGTFLEVIYAIRYLLETVEGLDTLAKGLDTRTRFFHGSFADVDALKNKTDLGVYVATTNGWTGLLSVQFDFYSTVSQVALSSSTPDYSEGSLAWKPAPCVMFRTYTNGAWSAWRKAGADVVNDLVTGGTDKALSAEMGKTLNDALSALAQELTDTRQKLNILLASLGEYAFPNGKPSIGNQFIVTQSLSGVTSSYNSATVQKYGALLITLTPNSQRDIDDVSVLVNNVDVTSRVYNSSTNVISIDRVTGDVNITVTSIPSISNYVQNGLVFHLDGIAQGNNQNAWTDLINNVVFSNNGAVKAQKGWYFDGSSTMTGAPNMPSFDSSTHTLEICYISELKDTNYFIFTDNGGSLVFTYVHTYQGNSYGYYVTRGGSTTGYGSLREDASIGGVGKRIVSYNASLNAVSEGGYINGEIKGAWSLGLSADSGHSLIGCRLKNGSYERYFKGTLYSIRIYSRKLSLAEMLANQRIDNERFGFNLNI